MYLGIDIGGTSVRAAVASATKVHGFATGPGGSILSSGPKAACQVRDTAAAALAEARVKTVSSVAVGAAGAATAPLAARRLLLEALAPLDLPAPLLTDDLSIAFRSASSSPEGVMLFAGTGAGAVRFSSWHPVAWCDAMGWLLGDEGSGVWLGRRVLRAAAADLDGRGPATGVTDRLLTDLCIERDGQARAALVRATAALPPAQWGQFARHAIEADKSDTWATSLLDEAATRLISHAEAVGASDTVVFSGGLLRNGGLCQRVRLRFHGTFAAHPVLGALILAAEAEGGFLDSMALDAALAHRTATK